MTHSDAQRRVMRAALDLFGEHGVSGTSLQMIATALGVTKAAVYHQFRSKDELVLAVAEAEMEGLSALLDQAEAAGDRERMLEVLLDGIVDLTVQRRGVVNNLQSDPAVVALLADHEPFGRVMARMQALVSGAQADDVSARVRAAVLSGAIGGAVIHPLVAGLDDDALRMELKVLVRRLFGLAPAP